MQLNGVTGSSVDWQSTTNASTLTLLQKAIPSPAGSHVLVLTTPKTDFIFALLKMGCQSVHVVDEDILRCDQFTQSLSATSHKLQKAGSPDKMGSTDGKLYLHKVGFQTFNEPDLKFNAIFDFGYVSAIQFNMSTQYDVGDKLIAVAAEGSKMTICVVESFKDGNAPTNIHKRSENDLNWVYGRTFVLKKEFEMENSQGWSEVVYIADKLVGGKTYYENKYSKGFSPWHMITVNHNLLNHYRQIQPENEPLRKIVLPMCGKTVDIKWLAERGHEVVGLEISESACREICTRDQIPYEEVDCPAVSGKLFRSLDGKVRLYSCDIFNFTADIEGQFESVWERGAVMAFEKDLRSKYFAHMKTLVTKGCRWMTSIFQYDKNIYYNHPFCVDDEEIRETFEGDFDIAILDETIYKKGDSAYNKGETPDVHVILMTRAKLTQVSDKLFMLTKK